MASPTDSLAAWQKAALDATIACTEATLASAEQLFKVNLEAARSALEQQTKAARDLLTVTDPQQLVAMRAQLAQASMQQSAAYAHSIYELVSQTQGQLSKLTQEQFARLNEDILKGAESLGKNAPGSDVAIAAVKSSVAASSAVMESLNRAAKQFQDLSEASIKAATANMVRNTGKK